MSLGSEPHDPARDVVGLLLGCFEEPEAAKTVWRDILRPYSAGADALPLICGFAEVLFGLGAACGLNNSQLREGLKSLACALANEAAPVI
jgi:hypothetical protein